MHLLVPCSPFFASEIHLDGDFCHAQAALTRCRFWAFRWPEVAVALSTKRSHAASVSRFEQRRTSSTAKVLVKAHLILKDAWLSYATQRHLELTDAVRPRSAAL
jgi:hypothetical protein